MADEDQDCTGEIWEGDPFTSDCKCFKPKGPTFQVDGSNSSSLTFASQSTPGAGYRVMKPTDDEAIANNTGDLKLCKRKPLFLIRAGIKNSCPDIRMEFRMSLGQAYPGEPLRTLIDWRIRYRAKFSDRPTTIQVPFSDTQTFQTYTLGGSGPNVVSSFTITISNLRIDLQYPEGTNCFSSFLYGEGTMSNSGATNDAWNASPTNWDPPSATFNNNSVHTNGNRGTNWSWYNTINRENGITYGPIVFSNFDLHPYGGNDDTPYGFSTVFKTVNPGVP